mgnify:CR=1 FL=1|jgi:uncharacterized protein (TIGR02058 family)
MTDHRFIIEMGMGNDLHGQDYTKAAARGIQDAMRHSTLPLFDALGIDPGDMRVEVTVGVQKPDQVDCAALAETLPRGRARVQAVLGGLDITNPDTNEVTVVAQVAIEAYLPKQS